MLLKYPTTTMPFLHHDDFCNRLLSGYQTVQSGLWCSLVMTPLSHGGNPRFKSGRAHLIVPSHSLVLVYPCGRVCVRGCD